MEQQQHQQQRQESLERRTSATGERPRGAHFPYLRPAGSRVAQVAPEAPWALCKEPLVA